MANEEWLRYFGKLVQCDDAAERLRKLGLYLVDYEAGWSQSSLPLEKLGYASETLRAGNFDSVIHPEDIPPYRALFDRVRRGNEDEFFVEFRIRDPQDKWHWIQSHGTVLRRSPSGDIALFAGFDQDITARKEAETLLRRSLAEEERHFALTEALRVAGMAASTMIETDATIDLVLQQALAYIPFELARVYAYDGEGLSVIGQEYADNQAFNAPDHGASSPIGEVVREKSPVVLDTMDPGAWKSAAEGMPSPRSWMGIPLVLHQELIGVLEFCHLKPGVFRSEHVWPAMAFGDTLAVALSNARKYQSLMEEAQTDPLTGLHSRRFLMNMGAELLARMEAEGKCTSVILLDIDHFKMFNDRYGHLIGDVVLRETADLCKMVFRQEDLICRFGGEEYVALLPNVSAVVAGNVAERIRSRLERASFPGIESRVTASLGIATSRPGKKQRLEELIELADQAMYRAKEAGRNCVVLAACTD